MLKTKITFAEVLTLIVGARGLSLNPGAETSDPFGWARWAHLRLVGAASLLWSFTTVLYAAELTGFSFYDADRDTLISDIVQDEQYGLADTNIAITANADGEVGPVYIKVDGSNGFSSSRTEQNYPYASFGNFRGDFYGRTLREARYRVAATSNGQTISTSFYIVSSGSNPPAPTELPALTMDMSKDFLSLHYDFAPDPDDVLSAVFDRAVVENEGLDMSRVTMVTGTVGTNIGYYQPALAGAMKEIWPSITKHDALNDFDNALADVAESWLAVLLRGGDVWVKEGGQSDFSSAVVQRIKALDQTVDTQVRVHLIQHGDWNESHTSAEALAYVKSNTDYVKIPNGNYPNNGTADLNDDDPNWWTLAKQSSYGSIVAVAEPFLGIRADGSDTVELLYTLGIGTNVINNIYDMLDYYLNSGPGSGTEDPGGCDNCAITGFTLVDADTDRDIVGIVDGSSHSYAYRSLAIRVDASSVSHVRIDVSGPSIDTSQTERRAPYASFGNTSVDYRGLSLGPGEYRVAAFAYDQNGELIEQDAITFSLK